MRGIGIKGAGLIPISMLGGGQGHITTYAEILRDTYGASEIYPLTNIPSGVTIPAFVSAAHDGTLLGWDLQNAAGPVTGTLAPYSDGVSGNDYGNISAITPIFNGGIGSAVVFAKVKDINTWSDAVERRLLELRVNGNNQIEIYKRNIADTLMVWFAIGSVIRTRSITTNTTDWFMVGMSWKDSANGNSAIAYYNGAQQGVALTGFGAWAGVPVACVIGAVSVGGANVWDGWEAYCAVKFGSIWTPADFAAMYADRLVGGPDVNP